MLPTFALAEWELPPDSESLPSEPATKRHMARFQGKEQGVFCRRVDLWGGAMVFVRGEDDREAGSWTLVDTMANGPVAVIWPRVEMLDKWLESPVLDDPRLVWARVVWFEGAMGILFAFRGDALWQVGPDRFAEFKWNDESRDWTSAPASEWREALLQQMSDPNSEARFAHWWVRLSEPQQSAVAWECEWGWENVGNLLRWMLTVHPAFDMDRRYVIKVGILSHSNHEHQWTLMTDDYLNNRFRRPTVEEDQAVEEWTKTFDTLLKVRPIREAIEAHLCLSKRFSLGPGAGYMITGGHVLRVEREAISHHDRAEAAFHLNEWGRAQGIQMLPDKVEPFDLDEWELPLKSSETREGWATFSVVLEWHGAKREFLLRQVEIWQGQFVFFARLRDGSVAGNFVLCTLDERRRNLALAWAQARAEVLPCAFRFLKEGLLRMGI